MAPADTIDKFFGYKIAGIDEAGRGPLAGPVVVAGVRLNPEVPIIGLNDSKKLTKQARESLYQEIMTHALFVVVKTIDHHTIDRINILQATLLAMKDAILSIREQTDVKAVVIDGNQTVPGIDNIKQFAVVSGDSRIDCIMAASIIAKVHRDQLMMNFHDQYPGYGFDHHKGYGTAVHLAAIANLGPCPIHRLSFSPFKEMK